MKTTVKQTNIKKQTNIFKIVAIVVVILFAVMVIGGMIKWYHFHASSVTLTPDQIQATKTIALNDIAARGQDPTQYQFTVMPKGRMMTKETPPKIITQAYFKNATMTQFYLIDLNTNSILMHSQTDYYASLLENKEYTTENVDHSRWFFKR